MMRALVARAFLECGMGSMFRHDPPWMVREWVMSERAGRRGLGVDGVQEVR